ncbi:tryptophan halogenase family protein [Sandaracinobacteroides hominis]|uniref:tryptophan halogenase family protein n=1 Tax=Sandaracinobacteroides hominis TaxID=2780086 RepID=UPI0018F66B44|nr:tryptophan halogenase family protein [Sandaracinobacteroides hominis]
MSDHPIAKVLIVGGGTAGWMSAALLARFLKGTDTRITLLESEEIGTVGVGEATVPLLHQFNAALGLNENEFVAATNGSFKLGIGFRDWGHVGNHFFHGFGDHGAAIDGLSPHHHWLAAGQPFPIDELSLSAAIAARGRFAPPAADSRQLAADYAYAFHFDAALYARYLRTYAENRGVTRIEGRLTSTALDPRTGHVASVTLADGRTLAADLFLDCSGFAGLLIEQALQTGYEDWTHWLPVDRAVVVPTSRAGPPPSATLSTAKEAGWQWRIPLQHREGNGHVYSSAFTTDDRARDVLLAGIAGEPLAETRILRFTTGRRRRFWNRNVVAIGLSGGFLEPLESTSIQLIQTSLFRLTELFPDRNFAPELADRFNRETINEYERVRDFLILHYSPSQRPEPLWRHVANMALPDTLSAKLEAWKAQAEIPLLEQESYREPSWVSILLGNGIVPHTSASSADPSLIARTLANRRRDIAHLADSLPLHAAYIRRHCAAPDSLGEAA